MKNLFGQVKLMGGQELVIYLSVQWLEWPTTQLLRNTSLVMTWVLILSLTTIKI